MTTDFENRVYDAVRRIPKGKVATYGMIARAVGCGSARAVGQALAKNPYAPEVPCHRVISSDHRVGGFRGCRAGPAAKQKKRMLEAEGVLFTNEKLADPRFIFDMR